MACPASSPESASGSTSTPVSGSDKSRVTGTVKEGIVGGRRRPTDCPPASVSASAVRVKDRVSVGQNHASSVKGSSLRAKSQASSVKRQAHLRRKKQQHLREGGPIP